MTSLITTWNRPSDTTPYAGGDVVGSATTANLRANTSAGAGQRTIIHSAELIINNTSPPSGMTSFRLELWTELPAAIADNAPFAVAAAERSKYAGNILLSQAALVGGGFLWAFGDYVGRPVRLSAEGQFFFFNLVTLAGYTPASGTEYQVKFHGISV